MNDANRSTETESWLTGYATGSVMDRACRRFAEVKERRPNCDKFEDLTWINGYAKCLLDCKMGIAPPDTSAPEPSGLHKVVRDHIEDLRGCVAAFEKYPEFAKTTDQVRQAVKELEAAMASSGEPAAQQWQPIETAPKDRVILGVSADWEMAVPVRWNPNGWYSPLNGHYFKAVPPTHWQPLPSFPPTKGESDGT